LKNIFKYQRHNILYIMSLIIGQLYIFSLLYLYSGNKVIINNITYIYSFVILASSICTFGLNYKFIHISIFYRNNLFLRKVYLSFIYLIIIISIITTFFLYKFTNLLFYLSHIEIFIIIVFGVLFLNIFNFYNLILISINSVSNLFFINLIRTLSAFLLFIIYKFFYRLTIISFFNIFIFSNLIVFIFFIINEKIYTVYKHNLIRSIKYLFNIIVKSSFNYINSLFLPVLISFINIYLINNLTTSNLNAPYNIARYITVFISFFPNSYLQKKMPIFIKSNDSDVKNKLINDYCNKIIYLTIILWIIAISSKFLLFTLYKLDNNGFYIYDIVISVSAVTIITSIPGFYFNSILNFKVLFLNNLFFTIILLLFFKIPFFDLKINFFIYLFLSFLFNIFLYLLNTKIFNYKIIIKTSLICFCIFLYISLTYKHS
jgi:O-antigen/teichoic acid export membrane protein